MCVKNVDINIWCKFQIPTIKKIQQQSKINTFIIQNLKNINRVIS